MTTQRDFYEILGVPRDADATAIRRAFRLRVRTIHPDVSANKEEAHLAFIELREAYAVLSDNGKRLLYDLRVTQEAVEAAQAREHAAQPPPPAIGDLLAAAERDIAAGHLEAARRTLKDIFARDEENPDATLLLVAVMQKSGSRERALLLLEAASERFPAHAGLRLALNAARREHASRPVVRRPRDSRAVRRVYPITLAGATLAAASLAWGLQAEGHPVSWLPVLAGVPWPAIRGTLLAAVALGWALATTAWLGPLENDILWTLAPGCVTARKPARWETPIGVVLPFMALLNWMAALGVWLIVAIGRGVFSGSLAAAFAISAGLAAIVAASFPGMAGEILAWLPGWALGSFFAGWLLGDFFRP